MRRNWVYGCLVAVALVVPVKRYDLGQLQPVEVVYLYREDGALVLETDTGTRGKGASVDAALEDLEASMAGVLFLDTADYLLAGSNAESEIGEVGKYLKPKTRICLADSGVKPGEAAAFLSTHLPKVTLKVWEKGGKPDELAVIDGKMYLVENSDKKR